jgi:mRNA interferase RelE/StbE
VSSSSRRWRRSSGLGLDEYRLRLLGSVERQLVAMQDTGVAWAIVEFITGPLLANPHRVGRPLRSRWESHLSAHVGAYRVVYRIDDDEVIVTVVRIGHRGAVYRR